LAPRQAPPLIPKLDLMCCEARAIDLSYPLAGGWMILEVIHDIAVLGMCVYSIHAFVLRFFFFRISGVISSSRAANKSQSLSTFPITRSDLHFLHLLCCKEIARMDKLKSDRL
jgi:hypothetical protein